MTTGHDVGKTRLDDLDRMVIRDSLQEPFEPQTICNFGSGASMLSVSMGSIGHRVYNYDCRDLSVFFDIAKGQGNEQHFTQTDLIEMKKHLLPKQYQAAVFQRVLHYLTYQQAQSVLQLVFKRLIFGGRMYLSFSGLATEIGRTYNAGDKPVESRWGSIDTSAQEQFSIEQNLCLYTKSDVEQLIDSIDGIEIERIWVSQFGNIKCVTRKVFE